MSNLVVYKASAGSGKTFTLAVSYIKLLIKNPKAYREILAVTFTNKATAEMKERIISQLYGIWKEDKESESYLNVIKEQLDEEGEVSFSKQDIRKRCGEALTYLLHDYNQFRVATIDSFFQSVMRNLARELDLTPNLNIELNGYDVIDDAVDSMIEKLGPKSQILIWLLDYIDEKIVENKSWNVSSEVKKFATNILNENYLERGEGLREKLKDNSVIPSYKKKLREMSQTAIEQMKGFHEQFIGELESHGLVPSDLKNGSRGIGSYFNKLYNGNLGNDIRNKTVEKCLDNPEEWATKTSEFRSQIVDLASTSLMPLLKDAEEFREKKNRVVNSCNLSLAHLNKLQLLAVIDEEMRHLNKEKNRFLLSDTNSLLQSIIKEGDSSFIFEKIGSNIRNIMIDEFQDTSRLQWQNFKLLLVEGLSQGADSLIVGDVKQSIYRWRSGDWSILNNLGQNSHFEFFPIIKKTLDTNRRSQANIIIFNNILFRIILADLNMRYEEEMNEPCHDLLSAYGDVEQLSPKEEKKGYVEVNLVEGENTEEYQENTLSLLGAQVQNLIAHGVAENDIAILVRKNKAIPQIADFFTKQHGITIVSDEAFRLDASSAILTLINALRLLSAPNDQIVLSNLVLTYQKDILRRLEPNDYYLLQKDKAQFLPSEFTSKQAILRELPLYELLEKLFGIFELDKLNDQDAYLFSFFDKVMNYLDTESSLLEEFLLYWDQTMCSQTIPSGEVDGIRILSIHKSKGLEFHTVLLPFTDWPLEADRIEQLIWCETDEEPYNDIDIVPITYNNKMNESCYQKSYLEERLQLWVDNLNLLYVALTRAGSNLIIYTKEKDKSGISSVINGVIGSVAKLQELEWDEEGPFRFGEICPSKTIFKKEVSNNVFLAEPEKESVKMKTFAHQFDFKQSNKSADFIAGDNEEESPYRFISRGNLLHELFSSIKHPEDIKPAIKKLKFDGLISTKEEEETIEGLTNHAFENPDIQEWYEDKWDLFNECAIIYNVDGRLETRRPDRVMVSPDRTRAVVVDFKFGQKHNRYMGQVKEYMNLLKQMGYSNIEGYIWYVTQNEVERI